MIIPGKIIADTRLDSLSQEVEKCKTRGITPTLAVLLVGDDMASLSYIKQKQKAAEKTGISLIFEQLPATISPIILEGAISQYNSNPRVHGLIVQRPIPKNLGDVSKLLDAIDPIKDVDGFVPNSLHQVPVARAVLTMLEYIHHSLLATHLSSTTFNEWMRLQRIAIIGRGETAGKPITALFETLGYATTIIHSQTEQPSAITKQASVIISCVGRRSVITKSMITPGVILISVGLSRDKNGKLHGDYEPEEIDHIASWYTPTPGGVGPVNVACLMQNTLEACILQNSDE